MNWLGDNPWALWAIAGLLCAAGELATLNLVLLMFAAGAFSGAAVAALAPGAVWLQALVAVLVAGATLGVLRPMLLRQLHPGTGYRSLLDQLVGSEGTALSEITHDAGQVRIRGEQWSARTMDVTTRIRAGATVEVYQVDGPVVVVYPTFDPDDIA